MTLKLFGYYFTICFPEKKKKKEEKRKQNKHQYWPNYYF